ncbi:MAG TPA: outer membrane beta-barrel protein [Acidobacteriaceae bacterium]
MICAPSRALLATALLALAFGTAPAQTPTRAERQLSRLDLGISGSGEFTRKVSGPILPTGASNCYLPSPTIPHTGPCTTILSQSASNTLGALATVRYIAKPLVGLEFNYGWARYTQAFTPAPATPADPSSVYPIQTTYNEYSFGYLITPAHTILGLQPFASAGAGTTYFKPTGGGGEGEHKQARAVYYYNIGVQQEFHDSHFGVRASFRQVFLLAPDFGENYLTIKQHTNTIQPTAGFYLRF